MFRSLVAFNRSVALKALMSPSSSLRSRPPGLCGSRNSTWSRTWSASSYFCSCCKARTRVRLSRIRRSFSRAICACFSLAVISRLCSRSLASLIRCSSSALLIRVESSFFFFISTSASVCEKYDRARLTVNSAVEARSRARPMSPAARAFSACATAFSNSAVVCWRTRSIAGSPSRSGRRYPSSPLPRP